MKESTLEQRAIATISVDELAIAFDFLDELRKSGQTNMFGATPYLETAFGYSRPLASGIHLSWMKTYSDADARARAEEALG